MTHRPPRSKCWSDSMPQFFFEGGKGAPSLTPAKVTRCVCDYAAAVESLAATRPPVVCPGELVSALRLGAPLGLN